MLLMQKYFVSIIYDLAYKWIVREIEKRCLQIATELDAFLIYAIVKYFFASTCMSSVDTDAEALAHIHTLCAELSCAYYCILFYKWHRYDFYEYLQEEPCELNDICALLCISNTIIVMQLMKSKAISARTFAATPLISLVPRRYLLVPLVITTNSFLTELIECCYKINKNRTKKREMMN